MTAGEPPLKLAWLDGRFAVCRLDPGDPVPAWALAGGGGLVSVTRTDGELSLVVPQERVPDGVRAEREWRALTVAGPLDFSMVGVMARLASALAGAGVSLLAISTYDTDLLLVRAADADRAAAALSQVAEWRDAIDGADAVRRL